MVTPKSSTPTHVPTYAEQSVWFDSRGVEYVTLESVNPHAARTYLTTHELAKEFKQYPETVFRWCRKWFGHLPQGRQGGKNGYRIPLEYRLVVRAWLQTEDVRVREVARRAILDSPKDFVIVVDKVGSTHYSVFEAVERVQALLTHSTFRNHVISLLYVGSDSQDDQHERGNRNG